MTEQSNQDGQQPSSPEERARKQARVRGLTDPLGSMGFRETPQRYRREARARRGVFGGAAASFVIGTALIIAANERGADSSPTAAATVAPTSQASTGQGAGQPQSATSDGTRSVGSGNVTALATEGPATGLSGDEAEDLLARTRPSLGATTNRDDDDDDRYENDDDRDDDDDRDEDDEDDDDDEHEYASSTGSQANTAPSSSGSSSLTEIVISQPQSHTQTSSTRD